MPFSFRVVATAGEARAGVLETAHGAVPTPVFMPVGTQATVKALTPGDLQAIEAPMILANAYHLYLRPGPDLVQAAGGLHRFMSWRGPILTDSGGFQVFSLGNRRQILSDGVLFRSHLDGMEHLFTPERVMAIQAKLGSDVAMVLDECAPHDAGRAYHEEALERTHRWAARSLAARRPDQAVFAITQGGPFADLRVQSARFLASSAFDGYALGGLSVGEPKSVTWEMVKATVAELPPDQPRYLMGVGTPEDLREAVALGVDMLDSVLPTRIARNGALFTSAGRINIRNAVFRTRQAPIDPDCDCETCRCFSVAYLHHLFRVGDLLAYRLATMHNVRFMVRLATETRAAILAGKALVCNRGVDLL